MTSPDQFGPPERGSPQSQKKPSLRNIPSAILRYGLAVVSVALALLAALFLQHYKFRAAELSLFLFAIALTAWYAGVAPAILASVLSILCFTYFFSPPIYSFAFSVADVPAMVILLSFALLIIRFSAVRRRIERQLLQARDELQLEVVERTQQASLLNLTHDAIFVRDMSATITYWNRGAEEMYGWTAGEASGKVSHRLLKTVFPEPLEQIEAKLMAAGRWEGELAHTSKDGTPVIVASRWTLQQDDQGHQLQP